MQRKMTKGFRSLIAWQEAKALTLKVYKITDGFPKSEEYGHKSQLRRASSSIMANLAEGSAMQSDQHKKVFYMRARGSVLEVDNFMELGYELGYVTKEESDDVADRCMRIVHLINKLMQRPS